MVSKFILPFDGLRPGSVMNHSEPSELQGGNREDLVSLASGSGIVMFGLFTRVLLVFATEVIAARILLADRYGLITWGLFLLNMLCMLAGFGLNTAIRRLLPIYQSRNDSSSARGIVILSGMLSLIGGCLYGLLLFIGAGWLAVTVMGDERETVILLTFVLALPLWSIQKAMLSVFNGFKIPKYKVLIEDLGERSRGLSYRHIDRLGDGVERTGHCTRVFMCVLYISHIIYGSSAHKNTL